MEKHTQNLKKTPGFIAWGKEFSGEKQPKVSVVVPVYNAEKYLIECLDSVTGQTLQEIQIICVDDGSTDGSFDILMDYQAKDDRITVINKENEGLSATRNLGIEYSQAEYVIFLDSDDYWDKDTLEKLYSTCVAKNLDVLFFDVSPFTEDGAENFYNPALLKRKEYSEVYDGVNFIKTLKDDGTYMTSAAFAIFRRAFLNDNSLRFYPGILHEDELFCFEVLMRANRVSHLGRAFYHYRIHPNSIVTSPITHKNLHGYFISMQEMLKYGLSLVEGDARISETLRAYQTMNWAARKAYARLDAEEKEKCTYSNPFSKIIFEALISDYHGIDPGTDPEQLSREELIAQYTSTLRKANALEHELDQLRASKSYRFGRSFSRIPEKIHSTLRCCKEYGLRYTIYEIFKALRLKRIRGRKEANTAKQDKS